MDATEQDAGVLDFKLIYKIIPTAVFGVVFFTTYSITSKLSTMKTIALANPNAASGAVLTQISDLQPLITARAAIYGIGTLLWLASIIFETSIGESVSSSAKINVSKAAVWSLPLAGWLGGIFAFFLMRKRESKQAWILLALGIAVMIIQSAIFAKFAGLGSI